VDALSRRRLRSFSDAPSGNFPQPDATGPAGGEPGGARVASSATPAWPGGYACVTGTRPAFAWALSG